MSNIVAHSPSNLGLHYWLRGVWCVCGRLTSRGSRPGLGEGLLIRPASACHIWESSVLTGLFGDAGMLTYGRTVRAGGIGWRGGRQASFGDDLMTIRS